MHTMSSLRQSQGHLLLPRLDALGATASFLCAVHCALLPLLIAAMPYAGFDVFENAAFDRGFVVFATLFGAVVIGSGLCRHRLGLVTALYLLGVTALIVGAFVLGEVPQHALLLATGGGLIAAAHLVNRHAVKHHQCQPLNLWWRAPRAGVADTGAVRD
jgi:MerC mercury resistance protein